MNKFANYFTTNGKKVKWFHAEQGIQGGFSTGIAMV